MTIYDPTALRRELHEMPELALHEKRTSAYVAEKLKALGIETHENVGGSTGVVGIIRGTEPGPVFMLRADMDALPFVIDGKPCCIHACGHDGHTAMLLAAASRLKDKIKRGTLKLLFQPAEETLQGAPVIIKAGVIDDVDYALGAHIRPIQDVPAGMLCAAVRHTASTTLTIVIKGRGAHASRPHLGINAIEAAALFIVHAKKRLPELLAGNAAAGPASSSIDLVSGGAAENVVPASASVTIDFRYQGVESAQVQCDRIEKILCEVRIDPDFPPVSTSLTVTGDWTALSTDMTQPLAQAAVAALGESLGHIPETTEMTGWGEGGSMQKFGIPAFYFGPGDGPLAHTPKESVSVSEIKTAVKALFHLVDRLVVHPKL